MIEWDPHQRSLRDRFAPWHERLNALGSADGASGRFSIEKWRLLCASGMLRLPFAERFGGLGEDLLTTMYVLEGFGYGCRDGGLGFSLCTHMVSAGVPLQRFGSEQLKDRYMPRICDGSAIAAHAITERQAGCDVLSMQTRALDRGDHYILTGTKAFVTNGPIADVLVVYARTKPDAGPFAITPFLVDRDTPGLHRGGAIAMMGLDGAAVGEVTLDGCRVDAANVVGKPGSGFLVFEYVMRWEVLCTFIVAIGAMQRRLERCIAHVRSRRQFGRPIGSFQSVANKVVDMRIAIETARRWLYHSAARLLHDEDASIDIAIAKLLASEANVASALAAVQIFGANGYTRRCGLEAELRDAVAGTIYSGTSEIQRDRIARMLGLGEHQHAVRAGTSAAGEPATRMAAP
jgi:alkylation response protein AidB-like acyl-CoA dehydrogenase